MSTALSVPELAPCKHCGKYHPQELLRCPTTDRLLDLRGRLLDQKFRLLKRLGVGGMAEVWLARNEAVDRRVAIKFLRTEIVRDDENTQRFRNEAKAAGRIRSRHVVEVLDFGSSALGPYIVMEWLRGRDLAEWVEDEGRLAVDDAVWVVRRILLGLADAHAAGVLHRDLKPANVFVHQEDAGELVVKVMDFGVARFIDRGDDSLTLAGTMIGTPEYMAPEQLSAPQDVDERADIWAVGAILYRILSGERVFSGANLEGVIQAVLRAQVTPLLSLRPDVPKALAAVVHRCLAREPAERPGTARELHAELACFEPANAGPVRVVEPTHATTLAGRGSASYVSPSRSSSRQSHKPSGASARLFLLTLAFAAAFGGAALSSPIVLPDFQPTDILPTQLAEAPSRPLTRAAEADEPAAILASIDSSAEGPAEPTGAPPRLAPALPLAGPNAVPSGIAVSPHVPDAQRLANRSRVAGMSLSLLPDVNVDQPQSASPMSPVGVPDVAAAPANGSSIQVPLAINAALPPARPTFVTPPVMTSALAPSPPGTIRVGAYYVLQERAPFMEQWQAKDYCEQLAKVGHLGQYHWHLPNPAEVRELIGHREISRSRYWTSAAWRGKAKVVFLPSGRMWSFKTSRSFIRPLCLTRAK